MRATGSCCDGPPELERGHRDRLQDQIQHVEMTQDMATYFNTAYKCDVFVRPEARMGQAPRTQASRRKPKGKKR